MKAVVEIIEGLKKLCPKDVPVGIRLCAEELLDDVRGNTPEESMMSYKIAEEAGIDYFSVTAGWQESIVPVISRDVPQGSWLHLAKRSKENVKVPIMMLTGSLIRTFRHKAIEKGELDIWEMCRPMIADPLLPKKVLEGREQDIRWCVACTSAWRDCSATLP